MAESKTPEPSSLKISSNKLVIEGGTKAFTKSLKPAGSFPSSVTDNVLRVLNKGRLFRYDVTQPEESEVSLLEKEFAEYMGMKYAVAFNSCSSSMFTALLCAGVKPGDGVFIPAFTFSAVPGAIIHAKANPVMIEVNESYCIDIDSFEKTISEYPETRTLLLSHMRGHVSDMDEICRLCDKFEINLIEDCAHALGAKWRGKLSGSFGQASCFSAQSYKMLDGGEGGLLVTNDEEIAAKSILYAGSYESCWKSHFGNNNPFLPKLQKKIPPFNFRMTMLTAAVIRPQIGLIEEKAKQYNEKYFRLIRQLAQSQYIRVPEWDERFEGVADSIQFNLVGLSEEQKRLFMKVTQQEGVPISIFGLDDQNARCFWNWNYFHTNQNLEQTRKILYSACDMRLPFNLTNTDIDLIADTLLRAIHYSSQ